MSFKSRIRWAFWAGRWRRLMTCALVVVAVYAALGFLLLPVVIHWQLPKMVASHTRGSASVQTVETNPFTFDLRLGGFQLYSGTGKPLVGFRMLDINFDLSSLFHQAYTFAWVRLDQPRINAGINGSGRLNLLQVLSQNKTGKAGQKEKSGSLPAVRVGHLSISSGRIDFADQSIPEPIHTTIQPANLDLHDFTSRSKDSALYHFAATIGGGQRVDWKGDVNVHPLRSHGRLKVTGLHPAHFWSYADSRFKVDLTGGTLNFSGKYQLDNSKKGLRLNLEQGALTLMGLKLVNEDTREPVITVPRIHLGGITFDSANRKMQIATVTSTGGRIHAILLPGHKLNLARLLKPRSTGKNQEAKPAAQRTEHSAAEDDTSPWTLEVNRVDVRQYGLKVLDKSGPEDVPLAIGSIQLLVKGYSNQGRQPMSVKAGLAVNGGVFNTHGQVRLHPLSARMHFQLGKIGLKPFQAYVSRYVNLHIDSGTVGASGTASYKAGEERPQISFKGEAHADDFAATDNVEHKPLVRLEHLAVQGIQFSNHPRGLSIDAIALKKPYARVIVEPDRSTNISALMQGGKEDTPSGKPDEQEKRKKPLPITVDKVVLKKGSAQFADLSLKPRFSTGLEDLHGYIKNFSTQPGKSAAIKLQGKADNKYSPVLIRGTVNPFGEALSADIDMDFRGLRMDTFSPYSGKFAGYRIKKGKMHLVLQYKLHHGLLQGKNHFVLKHLQLGEKVDSEQAMDLPLKLAIALLKDSNGIIDLHLPVKGNTNDPQFEMGALIKEAIVTVIKNVATAPFHLLAKLIPGGGGDLKHVIFEPGRAKLGKEKRQKLGHLAEALKKRPQLELEIEGVAAPGVDRQALARQQLVQTIRKGTQAAGSDAPLTPDEKNRVLALYEKRFKQDPEEAVQRKEDETDNHYQKRVYRAAHQRLLHKISVPDKALKQLADARANAVREALVEQYGVKTHRVLVLGVQTGAEPEDGKVALALKLDAR